VILSSAELLEAYFERWDAEKRKGHFARIRTAVQGMAQMLDDILVFGRAEAGMLSFSPRPTQLIPFCDDLLRDARQSDGGAHTFDYETVPSPSLESPVAMDEKLLKHILTNLLSNASKYSPRGTAVAFRVAERPEGFVEFEVKDQGIGIKTEDRQRLFESFHRGSNVGTIPGTGLGLAIVKRSVEVHRGTIEVESEEGKGTRFTVRIPIAGPA
jgi:signal transduction histidine kinase